MATALRTSLVGVLVVLTACVSPPRREGGQGRWITVDPATQRYAISADRVPRGALLDELRRLASVEVRPSPPRDELVSIEARDLDVTQLLARLLPADTRAVTRWGEHEAGAGVVNPERRKQGAPVSAAAGLAPKSDKARAVVTTGDLKKPADAGSPRPVAGLGAKPAVDAALRVAEAKEGKVPVARTEERATVRLTLEFQGDAPPRVIAAQAIEGRAPLERFTRGTHVFALVRPDGRLAQYGSFEDPRVEHSYLPSGPHDVRRATSGVVAISVWRENLAGARLVVLDASGLQLPAELTEEVVRGAVSRGKRLVEVDTAPILRLLEQGEKR
jgi:hypothetical protein